MALTVGTMQGAGECRSAGRDAHANGASVPAALFDTIHTLHTQYPDAGATLDSMVMEQLDELDAARLHVAELEREDVADADTMRRAQQRAAVMEAAAPLTFEQRMRKSQRFFHPDKRKAETTTSDEDKRLQFGQVKEAWGTLVKCRTLLKQLRAFQQRMAETV